MVKDESKVTSRQYALLTEKQREYLLDNSLYRSGDPRRTVREAIRERIESGLFDIDLLVENLEEKDVKLIIEDLREDNQLQPLLESSVAFLYRMSSYAGISFEEIVENAIHQEERERELKARPVSVEIQNEPLLHLETALDKIENGESSELTKSEKEDFFKALSLCEESLSSLAKDFRRRIPRAIYQYNDGE